MSSLSQSRLWLLALVGSLLMWLALPPVDAGLLAWIAPVPWLIIANATSLPAKRPYAVIWLASFVFWLAACYWLTMPHWATSFGLLALSLYLAFYLPVWLWLTRHAAHVRGVPLVFAAPAIWVALDYLREYAFTGFMMVSLAHTQVRFPTILQIADLGGAFAISWVLMTVAAALVAVGTASKYRTASVAFAATVVLATLWYGQHRLANVEQPTRVIHIALVQGSIDTQLEYDPETLPRIARDYGRLTDDALRSAKEQNVELDLIVWPETMFRYPWYTFDSKVTHASGTPYTREQLEDASQQAIANLTAAYRVPMLLGVDVVHHRRDDTVRYNAALLADGEGRVLGYSGKSHLVMFGEYVPFSDTLPLLKKLTPLQNLLVPARRTTGLKLNGVVYLPSICFESTLSRVVRRQFLDCERFDHLTPDVLVNLTNDGWFWGSAELDLHLACGVLRAIECRRPLVIAANTGFSAHIAASGKIVAQAKRRAEDVLIASVPLSSAESWYLQNGPIFAQICGIFALAMLVDAIVQRVRARTA